MFQAGESLAYPLVFKAGSKTLSRVKPVFDCGEILDDGAEATRVGVSAGGTLARIKASDRIEVTVFSSTTHSQLKKKSTSPKHVRSTLGSHSEVAAGDAAPVWLGRKVHWPLSFVEHHFHLKDEGQKNCGHLDLGICKHCLKNL